MRRTLTHQPGAGRMELDDLGGAAWGGLGGLVRWINDQHHKETLRQMAITLTGSVACAVGFGHLTQTLLLWHYPDMPKTVASALGFVAGVCSTVLLQLVTGLVSEVANRLKTRLADRIAPNGPAAQPGSGAGPTPAGVVGGGVPADPVPRVDGR